MLVSNGAAYARHVFENVGYVDETFDAADCKGDTEPLIASIKQILLDERVLRMSTLPLPEEFRPFFWDCTFDTISWKEHTDFVIARILSSGDWASVNKLREIVGDHRLALWFEKHQGSGMSPQKIRFWELVLSLSAVHVNLWLARERKTTWNKRCAV